jgi:hypothetical protein
MITSNPPNLIEQMNRRAHERLDQSEAAQRFEQVEHLMSSVRAKATFHRVIAHTR